MASFRQSADEGEEFAFDPPASADEDAKRDPLEVLIESLKQVGENLAAQQRELSEMVQMLESWRSDATPHDLAALRLKARYFELGKGQLVRESKGVVELLNALIEEERRLARARRLIAEPVYLPVADFSVEIIPMWESDTRQVQLTINEASSGMPIHGISIAATNSSSPPAISSQVVITGADGTAKLTLDDASDQLRLQWPSEPRPWLIDLRFIDDI